mmetsp:Transcript_14487/g.31461  ORF Transcript_14487/g.31461 Transcript_14487/m.31461 type:complete len:211 (-) Transcript_14487:435-1067(-)
MTVVIGVVEAAANKQVLAQRCELLSSPEAHASTQIRRIDDNSCPRAIRARKTKPAHVVQFLDEQSTWSLTPWFANSSTAGACHGQYKIGRKISSPILGESKPRSFRLPLQWRVSMINYRPTRLLPLLWSKNEPRLLPRGLLSNEQRRRSTMRNNRKRLKEPLALCALRMKNRHPSHQRDSVPFEFESSHSRITIVTHRLRVSLELSSMVG